MIRVTAIIALSAVALAGCETIHENNSVEQITNNYNYYGAAGAVDEKAAREINAALDVVYASISGPVGQERDWDAMQALFTDGATLYAVTPDGTLQGGSVADWVAQNSAGITAVGFTEVALANRLEHYGDIAHAWSSYRGDFTDPDGNPGTVRGVNSFQLMRQEDGRWLVQSIYWQEETPDNPLPADLEGK